MSRLPHYPHLPFHSGEGWFPQPPIPPRTSFSTQEQSARHKGGR